MSLMDREKREWCGYTTGHKCGWQCNTHEPERPTSNERISQDIARLLIKDLLAELERTVIWKHSFKDGDEMTVAFRINNREYKITKTLCAPDKT